MTTLAFDLRAERGASGGECHREPAGPYWNDPTTTCHCLVIDGRWRRQADHCPQHVDGETWRDA